MYEKITCHYVPQKCKYNSKMIEMILASMKFVISISHNLNHVYETFNIFHAISGFLWGFWPYVCGRLIFWQKITFKWKVTSILKTIEFYIFFKFLFELLMKLHSNAIWNEKLHFLYIYMVPLLYIISIFIYFK